MKYFITFIFTTFCSYTFVYADEIKANFEDWQYYCEEKTEGTKCELRQFAIDDSTSEILSLISINLNPENNIQLLIGLPHYINLKIPAKVNVDDKGQSEVAYTYCSESACFIAEILTKDYINLLKAGKNFSVESILINNETYKVIFSLSGFTAALNKLSK